MTTPTEDRKSGHGAAELRTRWPTEAADAGWTADVLETSTDDATTEGAPSGRLIVSDVGEAVS